MMRRFWMYGTHLSMWLPIRRAAVVAERLGFQAGTYRLRADRIARIQEVFGPFGTNATSTNLRLECGSRCD